MVRQSYMFSTVLFIILTAASCIWAQAPETLWTRTYSYFNPPFVGYSIRSTGDDELIIGGSGIRRNHLIQVALI